MNLLITGLLLLAMIYLVYWVSRLPTSTPPDPDQPQRVHYRYWMAVAEIENIDTRPASAICRWAQQIPDKHVRELVVFQLTKQR